MQISSNGTHGLYELLEAHRGQHLVASGELDEPLHVEDASHAT